MKIDIYHTDRQYDVIYADPPWKYRKYSGKGEGKRGVGGRTVYESNP